VPFAYEIKHSLTLYYVLVPLATLQANKAKAAEKGSGSTDDDVRPTHKEGGMACLGGSKVDSLRQYAADLDELNAKSRCATVTCDIHLCVLCTLRTHILRSIREQAFTPTGIFSRSICNFTLYSCCGADDFER
jgi:hypothetical protein